MNLPGEIKSMKEDLILYQKQTPFNLVKTDQEIAELLHLGYKMNYLHHDLWVVNGDESEHDAGLRLQARAASQYRFWSLINNNANGDFNWYYGSWGSNPGGVKPNCRRSMNSWRTGIPCSSWMSQPCLSSGSCTTTTALPMMRYKRLGAT